MKCKKCGSEKYHKSGFVKGAQRYKCKECGCQFVPSRRHGRREAEKLAALLLYVSGLSLRRIASLLDVSATAVLQWVRAFSTKNYEKPEPQEGAVVVGLDEMWRYIRSKKTSCGYGKLIVVLPTSSSTGNAEAVIVRPPRKCWTG